ncbi:MAG: hypothetical protein HC851_23365 [Acaryochloris sp. RU_4_1]|nr:hypothetical protein [Acaryochloris sp. RU_4_1]
MTCDRLRKPNPDRHLQSKQPRSHPRKWTCARSPLHQKQITLKCDLLRNQHNHSL